MFVIFLKDFFGLFLKNRWESNVIEIILETAFCFQIINFRWTLDEHNISDLLFT